MRGYSGNYILCVSVVDDQITLYIHENVFMET